MISITINHPFPSRYYRLLSHPHIVLSIPAVERSTHILVAQPAWCCYGISCLLDLKTISCADLLLCTSLSAKETSQISTWGGPVAMLSSFSESLLLFRLLTFWKQFLPAKFHTKKLQSSQETQRNFGSCSQLIVYEIFDLEQHLESSPKRRLYHLFVNSIICSEGEPLPSCHPSSENEQNKPPWPFSADHLHRIRSQTTQTTFQESIFSLVTNSILRSRRRVLALLITLDNEGRLYGSTWPLRNQRRNQSSDHGKLQSSIDVSG